MKQQGCVPGMEVSRNSIALFLQGAGLLITGALCAGYFRYGAGFAEAGVTIPWLGVPFFPGEAAFAACAVLYAAVRFLRKEPVSKVDYAWLGFLAFILIKAFLGFRQSGVFALRNAALFYYVFFALFTRTFYDRRFFTNPVKLGMMALILGVFNSARFSETFFLAAFLSYVCLFISVPSRLIRVILLPAFFFFPYRFFLGYSRASIVANLASSLFLVFAVFAAFGRGKNRNFLWGVVFLAVVFPFTLRHLVDPVGVRSMVNLHGLSQRYQEAVDFIRRNEPLFVPVKMPAKAYSPYNRGQDEHASYMHSVSNPGSVAPDATPAVPVVSSPGSLGPVVSGPRDVHSGGVSSGAPTVKVSPVAPYVPPPPVQVQPAPAPEVSAMENAVFVDFTNTLFRVFMWRDLLLEFWAHKPPAGFSFGKPFRSHAIEVLRWGYHEWAPVGWMCVHNSYLQILYYSGIVGISGIVLLWYFLFRMAFFFVRVRDWKGILLAAAVLECMVMSSFAVVLELPYHAIPFWSLVGLVWGYYHARGGLLRRGITRGDAAGDFVEKVFFISGILLIITGLIFNEFTVTRVFGKDSFLSPLNKVLLYVLQLNAVMFGIYVLRIRTAARRMRRVFLYAAIFIVVVYGAEKVLETLHDYSMMRYDDTPAMFRENPYATGSYRNLPGLDFMFHGQLIRTNNFGMASPDINPSKTPGRKRVLFMGDNFTFGFGVNGYDKTFVGLFGSMLSGRSFEILNGSSPGYGLADIHLWLKEELVKFTPDYVVLVIYNGNDFRDTYLGLNKDKVYMNRIYAHKRIYEMKIPLVHSDTYVGYLREFNKENTLLARAHFALLYSPFYRFDYFISGIRKNMKSGSGHVQRDPLRQPDTGSAPLDTPAPGGNTRFQVSQSIHDPTFWSQKKYPPLAVKAKDAALKELENIFALCRRQGIEMLIVTLPYGAQVRAEAAVGDDYDISFPQEYVRACAASNGIPYLDLLPPLRKAYHEDHRRIFVGRRYYDEDAQRLIASQVRDFFCSHFPCEGDS